MCMCIKKEIHGMGKSNHNRKHPGHISLSLCLWVGEVGIYIFSELTSTRWLGVWGTIPESNCTAD